LNTCNTHGRNEKAHKFMIWKAHGRQPLGISRRRRMTLKQFLGRWIVMWTASGWVCKSDCK